MKLKTTVDVTCSEQGKVAPYTGKLIGQLLNVVMYPQVSSNWEYQKEDGTPILSGTLFLTNEEADLLLTTPISSMAVAEQVFYGAFRIEMAEVFGISVNDIEICE